MKSTLLSILACLSSYTAFCQPLTITHLTGDFYIFTTYKNIDDKPFPSNGMYVVTKDGVIMFDTPWDFTQVIPLVDSIYNRHRKHVVACIATHFHDDRTAGLDIMRRQGAKTYSSTKTLELCKRHNEKQAQYTFLNDTTFTFGQYTFKTFYPGPGHTEDNIVIWCPQEKVLYGGCFVKSTENTSLGYIIDANLPAWKTSVKRTIKKFKHPACVIPGHFGWQSTEALQHTLELVKKGNDEIRN
jgi:metallo-beta-lactamase class B